MSKARDIADSNLDNLTVDTNTLVIDSTNNRIGIGTSSPATALDVNGTITADGLAVSNDVLIDDGVGRITLDSVSGVNRLLSTTTGFAAYEDFEFRADNYIFKTSTTERLRIDSSGNVGVGTSSLSNGVKTVIQGSQTGGAAATSGTTQTYGLLRLQGTTFTSALDMGTNGGNYAWIQSTDQTNLGTNYSLVINPNGGSVGIGTSTFNATYNPKLQITSDQSDGTGGVLIQNYLPTLTLEDISGGAATSQIQQDQTNMLFKNNGSERMRINSSGSVGIGTVPPSTYWGSIANVGLFTPLGYLGSNGNFAVSLYSNGYRNSSGGFTYLGINGNTSTASGIDLHPDANIIFRAGTASATVLPERMRIDSSGLVSFRGNNTNVQSNSSGVFINATRSNGNTNSAILGGIMVGYSGGNYGGIGYGLQSSNTSGRYVSITNDYHSFLDFTAGGFKTYTTTSTRVANSQLDFADELIAGPYVNRGAGSWTSSSDERLKQNISEISQTTAYNHVKIARAVQYNWKHGSNTSQDYIGFIAQDWETNYPEVVTTEDEGVHGVDDPKGVRYTETVPVLMAALKEAIAKIEDLETRVATLEGN